LMIASIFFMLCLLEPAVAAGRIHEPTRCR
jgi:hypothetical protein